jgi:O-antigen/teichoic acid export membrane protein
LRKFFVQNIFFLILVNLLVKPAWIFGIDRNVQNAVGHENYGLYQALFNLSLIFQTLLDFGLQNYNTRTVARSPQALHKLFPNIIAAKGILSLVYLVVVGTIGYLLGYRGNTLLLLLALCIVQILNSLVIYLRSNVAAMHRFKADSILSVADRLFMIGICSALLFYKPLAQSFRIEWFVYAQIAAYIFTSVAAFIMCLRLSSFNWVNIDLKRIYVICKGSIPYAVLIFLMAIYMRSDAFLLERLLRDSKPHEAGVYAASFRLLDVANNVTGVLFASILLPMYGRLLALRSSVQPIVNTSIHLLLPLSIATTITTLFFGNDIMMLLYDNATEYDGRILQVLMFSFPMCCLTYIFSTLITADGRLKYLIFISIVAVFLNLSTNLIFVPQFGALASALACVVTQSLVATLCIVASYRAKYGLIFQSSVMAKYLLFVVLLLPMIYGVHTLTSTGLMARLAAVGAAIFACMVICGFVSKSKIKALLSR